MARPRRFDDDEVVDRAVDLFWERGVDSVSIRDLEAALDLKAPSIYRRFRSKDQLVVQCIDRYVDRVVGGRIDHLLDGGVDPLAGLHAFFTSVLRPHRDEPGLRGCLLTTTSSATQASAPGVRDAVDRGFASIEAAFRRQVEQAIATGQLGADTDADAVAKTLMMSFQGLLVLARSGATDLEASVDATLHAIAPIG